MKRYEKSETGPGKGEEEKPQAKNALLQTYFTSLLCLVLCATMFLGTTYAWFTSEVTNAGNEIYIGVLDVDLRMNGQSLGGSDTEVFGNTIRWEPGYTALRDLTVVNAGDLAFNYTLNFTDGAAKDAENNDTSLEAVASCFDVWVYSGSYSKTEGETFADMTTRAGWTKVGTLAEVLKGKAVFSGSMTKDDVLDENGAKKETAHTYTIALHMSESAENTTDENSSNSLMGKSISLNVKLTAYQMGSEQDALSTQYDQMVATTDELKAALEKGGTVALAANIDVLSTEDRVNMNGGILDGNGNTITYSGDKVNGYAAGVITTSGGTVRNLTVNGSENGCALYITELSSDLLVSDCTLSGAYAFNANSAEATEKTMTFVDTTCKSWVSYANVMDHAYFTGCTFEGNLKPYGDTTLTNCIFTGETLDVSALQSGETVTLINCTYNGALVEMVVLRASGEAVTVDGSSTIVVTNDKMVALN